MVLLNKELLEGIQMKQLNDINWWHRIQLPDGTYTPGKCFHGPDGSDYATTRFGLPKDLTGKTVLDVGCFDGYFSFEAEKRGGIVTSIDHYQNKDYSSDGYVYVHHLIGSKNIFYRLELGLFYGTSSPVQYGNYDITLFYGVFYHLDDPFTALRQLRDLTNEMCIIETAVLSQDQIVHDPEEEILFRVDKYQNDDTNRFYPTVPMMKQLILIAGFSRVEVVYFEDNRATLIGYR